MPSSNCSKTKNENMLKCIIVDDQERDRENLRLLLKTYCPDVDVLAEANDKISLSKVLSCNKPDVIFLDIEIGKSTCFDIIDDLGLQTMDFKIIFVTGSENYAIKGYSYNGIDYILKPILPEQLIKVVHKAKQLIANNGVASEKMIESISAMYEKKADTKIHIKDGKNVYLIKTENILCFIGGRNYTTVKLLDKTEIVTIQKLKDFEKQLTKDKFLRVHRSYIINTSHITSFSRDDGYSVFLNNDLQIPVSKNYKKDLVSLVHIE